MTEDELNEISQKVIGCAYTVSNTLGCGFLEKVYENACTHEIRKLGLRVESQRPFSIYYDGELVGDYIADLLVEGVLLVELKAVNAFNEVHLAQCINYLHAAKLPLCLLMNFGRPRVDVKRVFESKYLNTMR